MERESVLSTFPISMLMCFVMRLLNLPPTQTFLGLSRVRGEERVTSLRTSAWEATVEFAFASWGHMPFSVKFNWKLIKCKCTIIHTLVFVFGLV